MTTKPKAVRNLQTGVIKSKEQLKFEKLQAKWYKKLKDDGFDDIEHRPGLTGAAQNSQMLKRSASLAAQKMSLNPGNAEYYRIMTNYLRCHRWSDKWYKKIFEYFCEGLSYRDILPKINRHQYKLHPEFPMKLRRLHLLIKRIETDAFQWNNTSPHGLNSPAALTKLNAELASGAYSELPYTLEPEIAQFDTDLMSSGGKKSDDF